MRLQKDRAWIVFLLVSMTALAVLSETHGGEEAPAADLCGSLCSLERSIPDAGAHPGNIFLEGEQVAIPVRLPAGKEAVSWRILDDRWKVVKEGACISDQKSAEAPGAYVVNAGDLPIGWYRAECLASDQQCAAWTTAAVLAKLKAPVPQDSPVCVDSATAWFAKNKPEEQEEFARLAALCGVNWIRDRLKWRDIQSAPGPLKENTTYDQAAEIQNEKGLKVLQVFHDIPRWAAADGKTTGRFPTDLRIVYDFCKALGRKFHGTVQAWEPWNESNVANFGAHTATEICAYQKAAYLGFKAGDPDVIVCWNVTTGVPTDLHTRTVLENETWPYFDTYNVHTYDWPHSYERLWEPVLRAACGRPVWVTESDRGIEVAKDSPHRDLTPDMAIRKAEFMAHSYVHSLHAGACRHFHFILGQYGEGKVQFGLLRHDKTPRPSYVALAACGRFLAGARCLGRVSVETKPDVYVFAFRAKPDGKKRDVLVAWTEVQKNWPQRGKAQAPWPLSSSLPVEAVHDYLGRSLGPEVPRTLTSKALFIVLPEGATDSFHLEQPKPAPYRKGVSAKVVLQPVVPCERAVRLKEIPWAWDYIHRVPEAAPFTFPVYIYNFSEKEVSGTVRIEKLPEGWTLPQTTWQVTLKPEERFCITVSVKKVTAKLDGKVKLWVTMRGVFGKAGSPVAAIPFIP